ncbi:MAG: DUF3488 and transglutaminase-like domain-containing protein [Desulfuromonadales bacterium]|nr:DUF3488 and transglutaminase-like domain-containing protein [Desulfuromonadales bacterium]
MVKIKRLLDYFTYAIVLLGTLPLFPHLDLPVRLLLPAALVAGVIADQRERTLLKTSAATLVTLAFFAYYGLTLSLANFILPLVNVLALLLAVRLVTPRTGRNTLQAFVLSLFALASSTLITLSPYFLLFMVLQILLITVGLVLLAYFVADPHLSLSREQIRRLLSFALILPVTSLLLMALIFPILPRTQRPVWGFLNPAIAATAGFSEQVKPGSVAELNATKQVVFRVESERLPQGELYWRGIVLDTLRGNTWLRGDESGGRASRLQGGQPIRQTISLEPQSGGYLFALDRPESLQGIRHSSSPDLVHRTSQAERRRVRYEANSRLGATLRENGSPQRTLLTVPAALPARVQAVADRIRQQGRTVEEKIALTEDFFRQQQLSYATSDLPDPQNPIDDFLFGKRRGYCEFFASSFAVILRQAEVPTRLVGGYLGGDYNALGGYYLVTEDMAHVWVEARLEDGRWTRIDPSRLAINAATAVRGSNPAHLGVLRQLADSASHFWAHSILNYDLLRQIEILRNTGERLQKPTWRPQEVPRGLLPLALAVAAIILGYTVWHRRKSREQRLVARFQRLAAKQLGLGSIPPHIGIHEIARRLKDPLAREFAERYGQAIYQDRRLSRAEIRELNDLLRRMRGQKV